MVRVGASPALAGADSRLCVVCCAFDIVVTPVKTRGLSHARGVLDVRLFVGFTCRHRARMIFGTETRGMLDAFFEPFDCCDSLVDCFGRQGGVDCVVSMTSQLLHEAYLTAEV